MYRPLPNGITIGKSGIDGLGVIATKEFKKDVVLGIVHIRNKNFPHGYIRTALGAFYNHNDNFQLRLSIENLTDKKYTRWASVAELPENDEELDLFGESGRSINASFRYRF